MTQFLIALVFLAFSQAERLDLRVFEEHGGTTSISIDVRQGGTIVDYAPYQSELDVEVVVKVSAHAALAGSQISVGYGFERLGASADAGDYEQVYFDGATVEAGVDTYVFNQPHADLPIGVYRVAAWYKVFREGGGLVTAGFALGTGVAPAAPDALNAKRPDLVIGYAAREAEPSLTVGPVQLVGSGENVPEWAHEVLPEGVIRNDDPSPRLTVEVKVSAAAEAAGGTLRGYVARDLQGMPNKDDERDYPLSPVSLDGRGTYALAVDPMDFQELRPGVHQLVAHVTLRGDDKTPKADAASLWRPIFVIDGVPDLTLCGNTMLEVGEDCDGSIGEASCTSLGLPDGKLLCNRDCTFNTDGCTGSGGAVCGNNLLEKGETCDGKDFGGLTCGSYGPGEGTLSCSKDCAKIDTSNCGTTPTPNCGDGIVQSDEGEACDYGANNGASPCACTRGCQLSTACAKGEHCQIAKDDPKTFECQAACGNGIVDAGEQCDGKTGVECKDGVGSTTCWADCSSFTTHDGCQVVASVCGDGMRGYAELCDGKDLGGVDCAYFGIPGGGTLSCTASCTFDLGQCGGAVIDECGDGELDPGEQCDLDNLGDATCESLKGVAGTLACFADCTFNTKGCAAPVSLCGNSQLDPGEQCDQGKDYNGQPKSCCSADCTNKSACDDGDPCTTGDTCMLMTGTQHACHGVTGSPCAPGSTCSPDGTGGYICSGYCGNGVIDGDEACDGTDFAGATCESSTGTAGLIGELACAADCTAIIKDACTACGNGQKDDGEDCDGDIIKLACTDKGDFVGGKMGCHPTKCTYDYSGCYTQGCGDGKVQAGEQCDDGKYNGGSACACTSDCALSTACGAGEVCKPLAEGQFVCEPAPDEVAVEIHNGGVRGVTRLCYDIQVQDALGRDVWSAGDSAVSVSDGDSTAVCVDVAEGEAGRYDFSLECDPTSGDHEVTVWIDSLFETDLEAPGTASVALAGSEWINPCPPGMFGGCRQTTPCVDGQAPLVFAFEIMRRETTYSPQRAVSFSGIFCTADADCAGGDESIGQAPQLHTINVTCQGGDGVEPALHMDGPRIECDPETVGSEATWAADVPFTCTDDGALFGASLQGLAADGQRLQPTRWTEAGPEPLPLDVAGTYRAGLVLLRLDDDTLAGVIGTAAPQAQALELQSPALAIWTRNDFEQWSLAQTVPLGEPSLAVALPPLGAFFFDVASSRLWAQFFVHDNGARYGRVVAWSIVGSGWLFDVAPAPQPAPAGALSCLLDDVQGEIATGRCGALAANKGAQSIPVVWSDDAVTVLEIQRPAGLPEGASQGVTSRVHAFGDGQVIAAVGQLDTTPGEGLAYRELHHWSLSNGVWGLNIEVAPDEPEDAQTGVDFLFEADGIVGVRYGDGRYELRKWVDIKSGTWGWARWPLTDPAVTPFRVVPGLDAVAGSIATELGERPVVITLPGGQPAALTQLPVPEGLSGSVRPGFITLEHDGAWLFGYPNTYTEPYQHLAWKVGPGAQGELAVVERWHRIGYLQRPADIAMALPYPNGYPSAARLAQAPSCGALIGSQSATAAFFQAARWDVAAAQDGGLLAPVLLPLAAVPVGSTPGFSAELDPTLASVSFSQGPLLYHGGQVDRAAVPCGDTSCIEMSWDIEVGFATTAPGCRLTFTATSSPAPGLAHGTTPQSTAWPVIRGDIPLTSEASEGVFYDSCWHSSLNGEGSGLRTGYTALDAPESFCYRASASRDGVLFHGCQAQAD